MNKNNSISLIDGSGFIFRAYYALPSLTNKNGVPIGAVMSDVANSADLIAQYGYDNVEALGKAAVEAAEAAVMTRRNFLIAG